MKKKGIIILSSVVVVCALGLLLSPLMDWNVDSDQTSGNIGKTSRFSRKTATEGVSNMQELLLNDEAYKNGVVASYVVMQTRAKQFDALVDLSNQAAGSISEFDAVLKDMNEVRPMIDNVCASLSEAGEDINAALSGQNRPDLAQNTLNASLAYTTLQKQNKLADRFITTTDNYLKTSEGTDDLKFVRDQWVNYQQMTAALNKDDKAAAELRKMLGKDAKPQANGYGGITNAVQNAAKAKSKDSAKKAQADNGEIGRSIMKERNPHYANK